MFVGTVVCDLMVLVLIGVTSPGRGECPSPRCWREWGFSGSKPGVEKERGWRERDHLK